jgi:hypothetical protein
LKPFAYRRWWRNDGLPALRLMAVEHWDPLNVYDNPAGADSYDPFLERVGRMLRKGKGPDEIARYLGEVRTKAFGRDESESVDELFAERVVAWFSLDAPK